MNLNCDESVVNVAFNVNLSPDAKGKINKDEPEIECAAREVHEEVGVDFAGVVREEDSIVVNRVVDWESGLKQRSRLFIVPGVSEQTFFATQTRKEISEIAWHPLTAGPHISLHVSTFLRD